MMLIMKRRNIPTNSRFQISSIQYRLINNSLTILLINSDVINLCPILIPEIIVAFNIHLNRIIC